MIVSDKPKTSTRRGERIVVEDLAVDSEDSEDTGRGAGSCFHFGFGHGLGAVVYCSIMILAVNHVHINLLTC